ncbi:hypothetical protein MIDIC_310014 [Alphaproteobacteria bacterium]
MCKKEYGVAGGWLHRNIASPIAKWWEETLIPTRGGNEGFWRDWVVRWTQAVGTVVMDGVKWILRKTANICLSVAEFCYDQVLK